MTEAVSAPPSATHNFDLAVVQHTARQLLAYCRARDWTGYDPYDALNSRVFRCLPLLHFKLPRLLLTQVVKRSPINLRPLLLVPQTQNPKGVALFASSLLKFEKAGLIDDVGEIQRLVQTLLSLRSDQAKQFCWGYNFDWQTRFRLVPRASPNIICTSFAANALLDAYEWGRDPRLLNAAVSAADFILDVLFWSEGDGIACFNYTPLWRSQVHNASLLGAALLCRVSRLAGERRFLEPALRAARYSVRKQHADGAWDYGESDSPSQRWKDNFHTGYNLCALSRIGEYAATDEFQSCIGRGLEYYLAHFFREDGAPRYFHDSIYPIDIHSVAQSILTLVELRALDPRNLALANSVFRWALANMWDSRGYFYFQKLPRYTVRIPFMRWSEAWMLLALATVLETLTVTESAARPGVHAPAAR